MSTIKYLGIGNPLLDITAPATAETLKEFELVEGTAILAEEKHMALYPRVQAAADVRYCPGGSSMNTARALQWMLSATAPHSVAFVGCVGADESGRILRDAVVSSGVEPLFLETAARPTGRCAALITDHERTLVTSLAAAELYDVAHLRTAPAVQAALASAQVYYSEGFFTTVSPAALVDLGRRALAEGTHFMFNVSAPFLPNFYWADMSRVLEYVDHLFCNETEAATVARKMQWPDPDDIERVAERICALPRAPGATTGRTAVITHGPRETVVCGPATGGKPRRFMPIKCTPDEIKDTNGAGDCFVAGFISQFLQGADLDVCVAAGHYCAWKVIHEVGCSLSGTPDFDPASVSKK